MLVIDAGNTAWLYGKLDRGSKKRGLKVRKQVKGSKMNVGHRKDWLSD